MSLPSQPLPSVPDDTARIARAAFRRGNPYVLLRDKLGAVFADADFADLYPKLGQPAYAPWRLALVTLMQFREGLSDRQAADAVRGRIDWKYLLALDLADAGFDFSVLCEFRGRLLQQAATERLVDSAYVSAGHLVAARVKHSIDLVGPGRPNVSWQGRSGGDAFTLADFTVDWDRKAVRCPEGKESSPWTSGAKHRGPGSVIHVQFRAADSSGLSVPRRAAPGRARSTRAGCWR